MFLKTKVRVRVRVQLHLDKDRAGASQIRVAFDRSMGENLWVRG